MRLTVCSNGCFALLLFLAVGCGSSDDPLGTPAADLSGEYTYEITGAGGTCADTRGTGAGVYRITQTEAWAELCRTRDLCDGESCREGPVTGDTLSVDAVWTWTMGSCKGRTAQKFEITQDDNGVLRARFENHMESVEGDCSAMTLPCDSWQTLVATPCAASCYDGYCSSRAARQAPEDSSGGE